jgi:hypothetical protein
MLELIRVEDRIGGGVEIRSGGVIYTRHTPTSTLTHTV